MKKFGFVIFIIAILVGVVFSNLFSFGRASGKIFNFSINSGVKGSGVEATEARNVIGFSGVDVGGIFHVEITSGKDFSVEVSADDNLLQYIKTEVNGDVLHISTTEKINSHTPMHVRISAPDIARIEASGASKVSLSGVKNSALDLHSSGASKLRVDGETTSVGVEVSGASSIDAGALRARTADVDASGASKVSVYASERLVSDASGASKVVFSGNPKNVEKTASGASSIRPN